MMPARSSGPCGQCSDGEGTEAHFRQARLGPRAVVALGLVLRELGANATKYGALPAGRTCRRDGFDLQWNELGSPAVATPTRKGFGPPLIERSLANFSDDVHLAYPPTGVTFTLEAPIEALRQV